MRLSASGNQGPTGLLAVVCLAVVTTLPLSAQEVKLRRPIEGHTRLVACVAFSPDGKTPASGSSDKIIKLWHIPKAEK
jgi:WD40 repeat protein